MSIKNKNFVTTHTRTYTFNPSHTHSYLFIHSQAYMLTQTHTHTHTYHLFTRTHIRSFIHSLTHARMRVSLPHLHIHVNLFTHL